MHFPVTVLDKNDYAKVMEIVFLFNVRIDGNTFCFSFSADNEETRQSVLVLVFCNGNPHEMSLLHGQNQSEVQLWCVLTHWGQMTHMCVGKLTNIGSDNGLSPGQRQAIIWTNAGILLIGPLGTNFSEFFIVICTFSFNKCTWKWRLRNGVHFFSASMC